MVLNNLEPKPTEIQGFKPGRFEVPKPKESPEHKQEGGASFAESEVKSNQAGSVLEEGQIRRAIEHAVEEVKPKVENGRIEHMSQEDLRHVIENVELNLGTKLDGMSPHQLLETLINLPRNNN
jgi:hypothetical protein